MARDMAPQTSAEEPMPRFTWDQLERRLERLTDTTSKAAMVRPLVCAVRKQHRFKPPELVLEEILCLAWALLDEEFQPGPLPGEQVDMP
jgi:hypothetical protein